MRAFGSELILDLQNCNVEKFRRENIEEFLSCLCEFIEMESVATYFWEYEGNSELDVDEPLHSKGISAVQFIKTSSIVLHTVDENQAVYLNVFSCKDFDGDKALQFIERWFDGMVVNSFFIERP